MRYPWLILLLLVSVMLAACGSTATPLATEASALVTISLQTTPEPPAVGEVSLIFHVLDESGQPVSEADFDVIADHTDMSGMTMHGKASDQGDGFYAITTNFSMPGNWKLTVQVRKGELDFKQDIDILVE